MVFVCLFFSTFNIYVGAAWNDYAPYYHLTEKGIMIMGVLFVPFIIVYVYLLRKILLKKDSGRAMVFFAILFSCFTTWDIFFHQDNSVYQWFGIAYYETKEDMYEELHQLGLADYYFVMP